MSGVLGRGIDEPKSKMAYPTVPAELGATVIHRASRFRGIVIKVMIDGVVLRGASGDERSFRFIDGAFLVDNRAVSLHEPKRTPAPPTQGRTASGSIAAPPSRARTARTSRLWVEGIHDAALVEKIWGDDLREQGIVVERLDGIDHLADEVLSFDPGPAARLGVLVDHLVPGSKESRIASRVSSEHVLVRGTPYVDVWQAIRPKVIGIAAWPEVPRSEEWKQGICRRLGVADPMVMWRRLLSSVRTYADLEPSFVGAVESLIDFLLEGTDA